MSKEYLSTNLQAVINKVDELKPNSYSDEQKTEWISKVEGIIKAELFEVPEEGLEPLDYELDKDKPLRALHPYRDIYEFYVKAMIDYNNNDIESYTNSMEMFNATYEEYAKYVRRQAASKKINYMKNIW